MADINKLSYEEAIAELEGILETLGGDDLTLEGSLGLFRKGMALYKRCNDILSKTEGEIKLLTKDSDNSILEEEFLKEVDEYY